MHFQHVYDQTLSQNSYFIGCKQTGVAAVIDPKRDIDTYLDIAVKHNMLITHVLETHIHTDFLCGSRELAALTGAQLYLSDEGGPDCRYAFDHIGLHDGDRVQVGKLELKVLHTPGHTPESLSFLLTDKPASNKPVMLFTGDFVLVGDVGRPDVPEMTLGLKAMQEAGAHQLYHSLKNFSVLPGFLQVWPGHGAGPAGVEALSKVPSTTVGYEVLRNQAFHFEQDEEGFVRFILASQPEKPARFARLKKLNKGNRPLLTELPVLTELDPDELKMALSKGYTLVDTRDAETFSEGFIPGSFNIPGNDSFNTWAGWFLNDQEAIILLADPAELEELTRQLMRIGLDNIYGYIPSTAVWQVTGGRLKRAKVITLDEFRQMRLHGVIQVVDLRSRQEYEAGHIRDADHLFVGTLLQHLNRISWGKTVVMHCENGERAMMGYSLLDALGYKNIFLFAAGMKGWLAAGNDIVRK